MVEFISPCSEIVRCSQVTEGLTPLQARLFFVNKAIGNKAFKITKSKLLTILKINIFTNRFFSLLVFTTIRSRITFTVDKALNLDNILP